MQTHEEQRRQTERVAGKQIEIILSGEYQPHLYDTLSGKVLPVSFRHSGGKTVVMYELFPSDSLLLRFSEPHFHEFIQQPEEPFVIARTDYKRTLPYRLEEPNVLLLDQPEYQLDDGAWQAREEMLRLDNNIREKLHYPSRMEKFAQPWVIPDEPPAHTVTCLLYTSYRAELAALREKYRGKLEILMGIEQDYYATDPAEGYDYIIGSVHYLETGGQYLTLDNTAAELAEGIDRCFGGDPYRLAGAYYQTVAQVVEQTRADIIGHFDLITRFQEEVPLFDPMHPRYREASEEAVRRLIPYGVPFEVNTGAMARGYRTAPYPSERLLRLIREMCIRDRMKPMWTSAARAVIR